MGLKEFPPSVQNRVAFLSEEIKKPEIKIFNTDEVYSYLSDENKEFLAPISDYFKIYLNCLDGVIRWKEHPNQKLVEKFTDTDYSHTLDMLKILKEIEDLGIKTVNFNTAQLEILVHDGTEVITNDVSILHSPEMDSFFQVIKKLEPRVFIPLVLGQIKKKEFFGARKELGILFKRYESRNNNLSDTESHLVKLIDIFQADIFGLENVNSKTKLREVYGDNLPVDSAIFLEERINKEISQLKIVLDSMSDPQEKSILLSYFKNKQFAKFDNTEYGYQDLYSKYLPDFDSIGQTLPSF
ncbi:MAG: hypothetical protein PHP97_00060 [Candidatus Shapirobacteria bacterium]|nr:hypothetical protein [Candidatus Shapirobacteria bacterium]MDD4383504.1 hypothetical protein [Candidatus Shapirobacteria bacterium]